MLFATLARKNQIPQAVRLAEAVKKHHPESGMVMGLIDCHLPHRLVACFREVLLLSNQRNPQEDSRTGGPSKASWIKLLVKRYREDIIYLDPETIVYGPFTEVFELLPKHPIVAVPFNLEPYPEDFDHLEIERLKHGFLDSGFLALRNSKESRRFADWWSNRVSLTDLRPARNGGADPLWLSLGVVPFRIHIMKEPGYQLAPWNWHEKVRTLTEADGDDVRLGSGKKLRSFVTSRAQETLSALAIPIDSRTAGIAEQLLAIHMRKLERIRK